MDDLFELIFSNPLFLILIIGGLISLFKGNSENKNKEQQQNQSTRQPQPVTPTSSQRQTEMRQQRSGSNPRERVVQATSIEEQRDKQLEQLTNRLGSDAKNIDSDTHSGLKSRSNAADKRRESETASLHNEEAKRRIKKKFQNNLTRDGLIDSVIMSEVLGSPRAKKPYESIINQRRRS